MPPKRQNMATGWNLCERFPTFYVYPFIDRYLTTGLLKISPRIGSLTKLQLLYALQQSAAPLLTKVKICLELPVTWSRVISLPLFPTVWLMGYITDPSMHRWGLFSDPPSCQRLHKQTHHIERSQPYGKDRSHGDWRNRYLRLLWIQCI